MANLSVTPDYLDKLAKRQDDAAGAAAEAASTATGVGTACWITHGVISGSSNGAFGTAADARKAAGDTIRKASADLAAKLRTAKITYEGVDDDLGGNLDKQMLSK
jgi:hypothetical protein